jgi:PKD repeat protein
MKRTIAGILCISLCLACSPKRERGPIIVDPSGTALLIGADGERRPARHGSVVSPGSRIKTLPGSSVHLALGAADTLSLDENATLRVDSAVGAGDRRAWATTLLDGNVFVAAHSAPGASIGAAQALVEATSAYAAVSVYPAHEIVIVHNFGGAVRAKPLAGDPVSIGACRKLLLKGGGEPSPLVSISQRDIDSVGAWAGADLISSITAIAGCGEIAQSTIDKPPRWRGTPRVRTEPGRMFRDTLTATDPEQDSIVYRLIDGPEGMKLTANGVITFTPRGAGTHEVHVRALDQSDNSVDRTYHLTVIGRVEAVLRTPAAAAPGDSVRLDASASVNGRGNDSGLVYRFDTDNDGRWDRPSGGGFGSRPTAITQFAQEGLCTVSVEVRSAEGTSARASRTVLVNAPPVAALSATPEKATEGAQFTFDASGSQDARDGSGGLRYRWDFNTDGVWDFPEDAGYSDVGQVFQMWLEPGVYTVAVAVMDSDSALDTATVAVTVVEGLSILALDGPDTVSRHDTVSFAVSLSETRRPAEMYRWDLDGDGEFERETENPRIKNAFETAGTIDISCKAIDADGFSTVRTRSLTVSERRAARVDAGGPYTVSLGDTCVLRPSVDDPDSTAGVWRWDYDGDGEVDWEGARIAPVPVVYDQAGDVIARLWTLTRDSVRIGDSATVRVGNSPPRAIAGPDIASRRGKRVRLRGSGDDPDANIVSYEWDFNADGDFDWSSESAGEVVHVFKEYSYAVLRVRDSEGAEGLDTVKIVMCPDNMALVKEGPYCIDRYEWPNKKGATPELAVTRAEAARKCARAGKRLCTGAEWQRACEGGDNGTIYPYGNGFEQKSCNTLGNKKVKNEAARSGAFDQCVNRIGCYDMSGNVAEWTSGGKDAESYAYGGWWQSGPKRSACASFLPLDERKQYPYVGFRCCK